MIEISTLCILVLLQIELLGYFLWRKGMFRSKGTHRGVVFVDTSSLMDGRILSIARSGFLPARITIPRSVTRELQLLADGSDSDKRSRARHGLELVSELQALPLSDVSIYDDGSAAQGVDEQLLELAKKFGGSICTMDFNLMKVAETQDIPVLNINELAQTLRMNYLPGERVSILIAQKGNDSHQGVGYLADGTMVVVEQAKADIGTTIEIEFIRSIQTTAGKMLFAKKIKQAPQQKQQLKVRGRNKTPVTNEDRLLNMIDTH